jgi:hypothetical protein
MSYIKTLERPRNKNNLYRQRSLYLKTNISSNLETPKSLQEIQIDEIQRIMNYDNKKCKFFKLFSNPIIANLDKSEYQFDLKQKIQFKITDDKIFTPIISSMIQIFKKHITIKIS